MKLHKESKGTIVVATIIVALFTFLSVHYLEMYSLVVIVPLFVLYGLVFLQKTIYLSRYTSLSMKIHDVEGP